MTLDIDSQGIDSNAMPDRSLVRALPFVLSTVLLIAGLAVASSGCDEQRDAAAEVDPARDTGDGTPSTTENGAPAETVADTAAPEIPLRAPDGSAARFAFRSGRITLQSSGDYNGIRRITFDRYGLLENRFDSLFPSHGQQSQVLPRYRLFITTPESYGELDYRLGKGQKTENVALQRYLSSPEIDSLSFGELVLRKSGGERLPDTLLQGRYLSRVYRSVRERYTHTIWVWGGIPIREEIRMAEGQGEGSYLLEPTKIEVDIPIADSLFAFPAQYRDRIQSVPPPGASSAPLPPGR